MLTWFSGDWKSSTISYFQSDPARIVGRAEAKDEMVKAFHDAFLERLNQSVPSTSRWYTFEPAMTLIAGGWLGHGLLPLAFSRAFDADLLLDVSQFEGAEDEIPWSVFNAMNLQKAASFLKDDECGKNLCLTLVASEPVDALNQRLQHLDFHGRGLQSLVDQQWGLLAECKRKLDDMLLDRPSGVPIALLIDHFC